MKKIISKEDLNSYLEKWQKILRLDHWTIQAKIVRAEDLSDQGNQGEVCSVVCTRMASIKLRDPIDWPSDCMGEYDMEEVLVHELLHCSFGILDTEDEMRQNVQHQLLNDLAVAFIKTARGHYPEKLVSGIMVDEYGRMTKAGEPV